MNQNKKTGECDYPHARSHPVLHMADLFRPVVRGRKNRPRIKQVRETDSGTLEIRAFEELDAADQTLMLTIFAIARSHKKRELIDIEDKNAQILQPLNLAISGMDTVQNVIIDLSKIPAIRIKETKYTLLKECKKSDSGSAYQWLKESLRRLAGVLFFYDGKKWSGSFHLLSWGWDKATDLIEITINPISAYSICVSTAYVYSSLHERHQLSDNAKLLHYKFVGLIRQGGTKSFKIATIMDFIWGTNRKESDCFNRRRRALAQKLIDEIGKLKDWHIFKVGRGGRALIKIHHSKSIAFEVKR